MTMFHYLPVKLKCTENAFAYWSRTPGEYCLIFIHGFGGHVTKTWGDFPDLLTHHPRFSGTDLIFYGYRSMYTPAPNSSAHILAFLNAINNDPAYHINRSLPPAETRRRRSFRFNHMIVAAHSLGGALTRQVIIDAHRAKAEWLKNLTVCLFAPAHRGANITELGKLALSSFFFSGIGEAALKIAYPALKDLEANSSFIVELAEEYRAALGESQDRYLVADKVITASEDIVVNTNRFCNDPPNIPFQQSHSGVCKPRPYFHAPFEQIEELDNGCS